MYDKLKPQIQATLQEINDAGLYKNERIITTPQGADIMTSDGKEVTNLVNEFKAAGYYSVQLEKNELPSGMYLYKIQVNSQNQAEKFSNVKKMLLLK